MKQTKPPIHCPIKSIYDIVPCDPAEVEPLVAHLQEDRPVETALAFPRGTVLADGRLDLCKQSLGPANCRRVTDALAGNTRIKSLLLGTDGIGDTGAADVAGLIERNSHLEIVYLGCNRISALGTARLCEALAGNTTVAGLWLKRNPIGPEGARQVAAMLRTNRSLRTLDLVNTDIGAEGATAVIEALIEDNRSVERLYLGGNALDAAIAERLAVLLRTNPVIKALLLSVNAPGDDGALALSAGLYANSTLEELGLASCGITTRGAQGLWSALSGHPALRFLDLGYSPSTRVLGATANHLGDAGADDVAMFLEKNTPLRHLNLTNTGIGPAGRARLAEALCINTHLSDLRLDGKTDERIVARLTENRSRDGLPENSPAMMPPEVAGIRSVYRTAV